MRRRTLLAALCAGATGALAGCTVLGSDLSDGDFAVEMYADRFDPRRHEVSVGDTVRWGNTGSRAHTVTAYGDAIPEGADYFASGGFDSEAAARDAWPRKGGVTPGETYAHTFETAGEFGYFCIPHEPAGMVGTVVVRE